MRCAYLGVLITIVAGCGKKSAECRKEAHELAAFLSSVDHGMPPVRVDDSIHLVQRTDVATQPAPAPTISLTGTRLQLDGREVLFTDLTARLAETHHAKDPQLVDLVIDEATSWEEVVMTARSAAEAGFTHQALIFATPAPAVTPPPPSGVDAQLDAVMKAEPSERATQIADLMMKTIDGCPALQKAFGAVGGDEGGDKGAVLIRAIEPALVDCNCAPDLPSFRAIMYRVLRDDHPTTALTVTLDRSAPVLALPARTPWREASARFTGDAAMWLDSAP